MKEMEDIIHRDGKVFREEVKILLLGAGESGKSTIFKQMKIIQKDGGFSLDEKEAFKNIVYGNCITQMKVIVSALTKLGVSVDPENEVRVQRMLKVPPAGDYWTQQIGEDIQALWADKKIREVYSLKDQVFQLNDSASYFFDEVQRFIQPNYLPTEQDILRVRVRTTGIEEASFSYEEFHFRMLDVGGQRSERRKWIHCFDSVTAVIFCSSLVEYDQNLREDDSQNRMRESLLLFDEICNSPWFRETDIVLFLNKTDLFKTKATLVNLNVCFPEYNGGLSFENASAFIKQKFLEQDTSRHTIYVHFTCAINTNNVEFVFRCVKDTLLKQIMKTIAI